MACMTHVQRGARLKVAASALVHAQERVARGLVRLVAAVPERTAPDGLNGCCRPVAVFRNIELAAGKQSLNRLM